jgi:hypothetical protein
MKVHIIKNVNPENFFDRTLWGHMVMSAVAKNLSFYNFFLTTGIFLGFIKHETILRAGFPKGQIEYTFPIKKIAFPEPLDWF